MAVAAGFDRAELLEQLLGLASEAGIPVRVVGAPAESLESAVVKLRGQVTVVLSRSDPPDAQIALLARTLKRYRAELLETRYLTPALRECIDAH